MKRIFAVVLAGIVLVGCGDSSGETDRCTEFASLIAYKSSLKPEGYDFDENADGYLNAAEVMNKEFESEVRASIAEAEADYAAQC